MQEKIIDYEDALDRVQDDQELLMELFDIFEEDFKVRRKELEQYIAENNIEMVRNIAHSLKGASGNISAQYIQKICLFIEKQAAEESLDCVSEKLLELDEQFDLYKKEVQKLRDENGLV